MIEKHLSQNGNPIFTWHGKHLCSRYNPISEAQTWVQNYSQQVMGCSDLIVLGLGCGYHIYELLKEYPQKKILVIETESEFIKQFNKNFPFDAAKLSILNISDEVALTENEILKSSLKRFYTILLYQPSMDIFRELTLFKKWLTGRDRQAFFWLTQLRSQHTCLELDRMYSAEKEDFPLSIKNIHLKNMSISREESEEYILKLNLLRELIT